MKNSRNFIISALAIIAYFTIVWASNAEMSPAEFLFDSAGITPAEAYLVFDDTIPKKQENPLPYPFNDRSVDPFPAPGTEGPLSLGNPSNIQNEFKYDPETGNYDYSQKMGDLKYRNPVYMTFDEYVNYRIDKSTKDYWREKIHGETLDKETPIIPKIHIGGEAFDRIFGGNTVDIKPQGTAELIFGVMSNKIDNPAIPERNRRQTAFDFDQKIQLNVIGNIGEKLKLTTSYNTESTFDFENQMKLEYTGYEDEIIKKIEAGNVNLPLTGSLITGSQSLFGIKTQLQFGRLTVTSVFSQQKGKKQEVESSGGAQTSYFDISADNYEYNKHFFLSQYFRDNYNKSMSTLPVINSTVNITKVEVWITNTNISSTTNIRNVVGFMDLGESNYYDRSGYVQAGAGSYPDNEANSLYKKVSSLSPVRNFLQANSYLNQQTQLEFAIDYDVAQGARLLTPAEYTFHPQLGFISLNQTLNPDQVLAVAFQYTVGGSSEVFQVGEFSTDGVTGEQALVLKLLKSTNLNTQTPMWDLMMKNIYSIGAYSINKEGFKLDVVYNSIDQGINIPYLPEGAIRGKPLIQVMKLDRLNAQEDASPDGVFDFLTGRTINPSNGRIYFPVLEPFGVHLREQITGGNLNLQSVANKYAFEALYDTTKIAAQQRPDLNRFRIKGSYQSTSSSEISLNAMNVPQGSVTVTAGGAPLTEGTDYTVDYTLGKVKIINASLLESNTPIKVSLESNQLFAIQSKSLFGTHFDYKINNDFTIGATIMNLTERPLTQKVNFGDEPMSNTIWGIDANYRTDAPFLTKMVDKLPFLSTKEMSTLTFQGEFAHLIPGNSKAIGKEGTSYIDDFEGSQSVIDIRSSFAWSLASAPQKQPALFPEADLIDNPSYGFNRAKLAWYTVDPLFWRNNNITPDHIKGSAMQSNHYMREVQETEIFPNRNVPQGQIMNMPILDLALYPREKGPYNYDLEPTTHSAGIDQNGFLNNPKSRWAGIMRKIDQNDFETANIEYIQFWVMDPFHPDNGIDQPDQPMHSGGDLYFNLGNISEDILRDDRKSFEHGLPTSANVANVDTTAWGRIPTLQSLVNAFDNNETARPFQDVGYDGLENGDEKTFFKNLLDRIAALYGPNSTAYKQALNDPSADDFKYFRGIEFDNEQRSILGRYKDFNGPEGNSSTTQNSKQSFPTAATQTPNAEDINRDNTLSTNESYYQYRVSLRPEDMVVGQNFITDKVTGSGKKPDGQEIDVDWYQFKIPIRNPEKVVGGIQDFTSIRFIRMFLTGFSDSIVCRFGRLELVRGEWRKYLYDLRSPGEYIADDGFGTTLFDVGAVNIEENGVKTPVNYVLPPGIDRVIDAANPQLRRLNEQSMVLKVCGLEDGDAKAAYRNTNFDVRSYKRLKMFVHAEELNEEMLKDGDLRLFVRLGRDYNENYYEYEIPLVVTPPGKYNNESETDRRKVWPEANEIDIPFELLTALKLKRNSTSAPFNVPYTQQHGDHQLAVVGNPQMSEVSSIMIGVRNPKKQGTEDGDDGFVKCAEIWVNELRLSDFDKSSGWATTGRMSAKLADFGDVTASANMSTPGFGSIEKKISERQRATIKGYDLSGNFRMGQFFPENLNLSVPMFLGYSEGVINPQFHPNDPDIEFKELMRAYDNDPEAQKIIREMVQDYTRRRSINFANVKKEKGKGDTKSRFYDIENFSFTYAYNETFKRDINTLYNTTKIYRGDVMYNFSTNPKNIKPFSKSKALNKSKYAKLLSDFNFNTMPSKVSFSSSLDRLYNEMQIRNNTEFADFTIPPTFNKNFTMTRMYEVRHDFTKSLKFDFTATNNARIMEPEGRIDTQEKKDSIYRSLKTLGVNTLYSHSMNLSYTWPLNKFPLTDWVNLTTRVGGTYDWMRAPFSADSLGGTIKNSRSKQWNGQLNFVTLYNKVPYLKKVNQKFSGRAPIKPPPPKKSPNDTVEVKKDPYIYKVFEQAARVLMSVKNASFTYTENQGTILPGYGDSTFILGMNRKFTAPGWDFVAGEQDPDFAMRAITDSMLLKQSILNTPFSTTRSKNFNARTNIEPLNDLRIEFNGMRNIARDNQEFIRWNPGLEDFIRESKTETGNFSISYITWSTAFIKDLDDNSSPVFQQFLDNRAEISEKLAKERETKTGTTIGLRNDGFREGYGPSSQDVLIPAFLAAYSGTDVSLVSTNIMPKIPKPNWRITYDGLSKLNLFKKLFKSFTLSHAYRSSYNIRSYTTNLLWVNNGQGYTDNTNINGNFIPQHQIDQISITEQFSPLINIDMGWHNSLLTRFELKRDRTLVFNFTDNRLQESIGKELIVGAGYRFPNVPFPFKIGPARAKVKSDLNCRADISFRNNRTMTRSVSENLHQPTGGQRIISLKLAADYVLNQRVSLRLFYDKVLTAPVITTSFPSSNTNAGISLRFTLA